MAKYIVVDVESDGELLGENSMVCFGAVLLDKEGKLDKTFYGKTKPISDKWSLFHDVLDENLPLSDKYLILYI